MSHMKQSVWTPKALLEVGRECILDLLFPPRCPFCRCLVEGSGLACDDCTRNLPKTHGNDVMQRGRFGLCLSPLWYRGEVRDSIHRFKFQGYRGYAKAYGKLLSVCIGESLPMEFDLVTWAPVSPRRRRERGYDQGERLANALGQCLGVPVAATLEKIRHTPAQSGLESSEEVRQANVAQAYRLKRPDLVRGKQLLLVDDVVTSGATLSECVGVLQAGGAAGVVCTALARAKR